MRIDMDCPSVFELDQVGRGSSQIEIQNPIRPLDPWLLRQRNRTGSSFYRRQSCRRAAGSIEPPAISLQLLIRSQDIEGFAQNPGCASIGRKGDPVVHPFSIAARGDNASGAKVGEVTGDLRLALPQDLDEVADADLAAIHQVEKPQAGAVGESGKEPGEIEGFRRSVHLVYHIRLDAYIGKRIYSS